MTCWKCRGTGIYRVFRLGRYREGYKIVAKACDCGKGESKTEKAGESA